MRLLLSGCTAALRDVQADYLDVLGMLVTPSQGISPEKASGSGLPWAVDNAAFSGFDAGKFRRLLRRCAGLPGCLFVVCPDVVADARATLRLFGEWCLEVRASGHSVAFVGQNGAEDIDVPWESFDAWFVGGSTRWKLSQASADLVREAKTRGMWCHMGRVNSYRRLRVAIDMGCDSVDGTGMSCWGDRHLAKFCRWVRAIRAQPTLY